MKSSFPAIAAATLAWSTLGGPPAKAASAPKSGAPHFVLNGHVPILVAPPSGPEKGTTEKIALDLSKEETEGRLSFMDEIWYPKMKVPLHFHKNHTELFYVIAGQVEWTVNGETHVLHAGELAYIPPNTPHKVRVVGDEPEYNLFITMPGGFEQQIYTAGKFSEKDLAAPAAAYMSADQKDFNPLPDDAGVSVADSRNSQRHFALAGETLTVTAAQGKITSKIVLDSSQSEDRYTIQDETWQPGFGAELHYHKLHAEIFYVFSGSVEWTVGDETHALHKGDLVYIPPNVQHKVHVIGPESAHVFFLQTPGGYEKAVDLETRYPTAAWSEPAAKAALEALQDINKVPDPHPYDPGH